MPNIQQTFRNHQASPIYVSVEPWPECFELEPNDQLTLKWDGPVSGDALEVSFVSATELVISPNGTIDGIQFLFNGEPADGRSWMFKHR